jgi:ribosomal protein S18 acetylase RimI-like enzyme
VYVARLSGSPEPVATFTVIDHDEEVWGEQPPVAVYVHSLAIRRSFAGQGLGSQLLSEVAKIAQRSSRSYIRLDCWVDNPGLCAYYERLGFQPRGTKVWEDGSTVQRYERPVTVVGSQWRKDPYALTSR